MLLLAVIVVVFVGITVWSAMNDPPRYPPSPDRHYRDLDLRQRLDARD